jgi:hypothetical protein
VRNCIASLLDGIHGEGGAKLHRLSTRRASTRTEKESQSRAGRRREASAGAWEAARAERQGEQEVTRGGTSHSKRP